MSPLTSYRIRTAYTLAVGVVIGYCFDDILRHTDMMCYAVLLFALTHILNAAMRRQYER